MTKRRCAAPLTTPPISPVTNREIITCRDIDELSRKAAQQFVALSGGSTPKALYSLLATGEFRAQLAWRQIHLFWGEMGAVCRRITPRAFIAWSMNRCCRERLFPRRMFTVWLGKRRRRLRRRSMKYNCENIFTPKTIRCRASIWFSLVLARMVTRRRDFPAARRWTKRSVW